MSLPLEFPRHAARTSERRSIEVHVDDAISLKLKKTGGSSPFLYYVALLSAVKACLFRYTRAPLVCTGSPSRINATGDSSRDNAVPVAIQMSGEETFRGLLQNVRATLLEAYQHQDYPIARLLEDVRSHFETETALFRVAVRFDGLHSAMPEVEQDLEISLRSTENGFAGSIVFDGSILSGLTVLLFWSHVQAILSSGLANPDLPIDRLQLLSDAERRQQLTDWNATHRTLPERSLHELFEEQVKRSPQAAAVRSAAGELTYLELNGRANQLARYLQLLGVGSGARVALLLDRSMEMIVSILAVLKAGSAYVPMDPTYPAERLQFMLADAQPLVLLTHEAHAQRVKAAKDVSVVAIKGLNSRLGESEEANLDPCCDPESDAYVIYTSGSTGRPKGVAVEHRSAVNMALAQQHSFNVKAADRVLQFAALGFDASVSEWTTALFSGATLVMGPPDEKMAGTALERILRNERITHVTLPPSVLATLPETELPDLATLVVAGEACSPELARHWAQGRRFLNAYGPTEATVCASISDPISAEGVPIGRPIWNIQVFVLDENMEPMPVGVTGELYIGGAGLARGYLNRPDLTGDRFVPNPFTHKKGERLYRTGDLVRWAEDGQLEYIGRIDEQVKIRGYRIEPGEIAAVLKEHGNVHEAVVIACEDQAGEKRLMAYVEARSTTRGGPSNTDQKERLDTRELKEYLASGLPDYMVPSAFIVLEEIPLTPNGKIDRKALPAEDVAGQQRGDWVAPRTIVEETLCGIWEHVLHLERIGIHDSFLELGGHSLLATQVISRAAAAFNIELPVRVLFEAPTIAKLAEHIEESLQHARGLKIPAITAVSREESLPLSFAQQRLWFLNQIEPESRAYNMGSALRLRGSLDVEALEKAVGEIVRRHEILRTSFPAAAGQPRQQIAPFSGFSVPLVDLSGTTDKEQAARELAEAEAQHVFDLGRGPLFRVTLVRLSEEDHLLLIGMHHIISDGWSVAVMTREFTAIYEAYAQNRPSPLGELAIQYADFAYWQRQWLTDEVLGEQLGFWREQLADVAVLELPTDYLRPAVPSGRGASVPVGVGAELKGELEEFSRSRGVTLFMTLMACWQVLLGRYAGQEDVAVGTGIANRNRVETEPLIGFFVNTLVLRSRIKGKESFGELLEQVRRQVLEAYAHQDLPFERLVEELAPERMLGQTPLFQVLFVLQNMPQETLRLPGLELSLWDSGHTAAKFDLGISLAPREKGGIEGTLEYAVDLFTRERMEGMVRHWTRLLKRVMAEADKPLRDISLLSEQEWQQVVVEWNRTEQELSGESVQELFERQAELRPEAVAVEFGEQQLSYAELNERANQVGRYLRGCGVKAETPVALCCERSVEMIVGMLGIVKAGGVYVPLDAGYPEERLRWMLQDAGATVLLTAQGKGEALSEGARVRVRLDEDWEQIASESGKNLEPVTGADNLAYLIYTSGSTGQPKGVAIEQRSIIRLVINTDYVQLEPQDRIGQASNTSFDAATFEIWGALLNGATLVGIPKEVILVPADLQKQLRDARITALFLTTAVFQEIIDAAPQAFSGLKHMLFGGEAVDPAHVRKLVAGNPPQRLLHVYGPTETTTFATWHRVCSVGENAFTVPIGGPIRNTTAYILDEELYPVPVGVKGELYLGGVGVGRGYWNRPCLTAERFIPDPFSSQPCSRLYRTGDVVRWNSEGAVEFIGRRDHQVKIRGFRIEPGEIETVLAQYPGIRQVAVLVLVDDKADKYLAAYVAGEADQRPTAESLRTWLSQRVPDYMVPRVFVVLEQLPLNSNGKLDRKGLPDPKSAIQDSASAQPGTPVQEMLAGIWVDILKLERIGIHDTFFELGGHSLLATQIMSRVRSAFGIDLPLRTLFESPTIALLAERIETALRGEDIEESLQHGRGLKIPAITAVSREESLPLSFAQQRLWFLNQIEPESRAYNMGSALRLRGSLDVEALEKAVGEIVRRHEILRTSFPAAAGQPRQQIAPFSGFPVPLVDLSGTTDKEQAARELAEAEAQHVFDLGRGPLFRVTLVRLSEEDHLLLIGMHHIISDGWSVAVMTREFTAIYEAYAQNRPSPLGELAIQYADFAYWQRQWLTDEVLGEQLGFWREQLADVAVLELPTDYLRPAVPSGRGASVPVGVGAELKGELEEFSRSRGVTLFMTLMACWQVLLGRYAGQEDVAVGTGIANRNRMETEPLIGFFVNTLVLRSRIKGKESFGELLEQVRRQVLEAYAHQDLPFERLVEELAPERMLGQTPLFQVLFVLQNMPQETLRLPGLELSLWDSGHTAAKFDLGISLAPREKGGIEGTLEYAVDLFTRERMEGMVRHWTRLLKRVMAEADKPLRDISLLSEQEWQQVVVEWNRTEQELSGESVQELFERQAELRPEAVAVEFGEQQLSYAELNERANQVGRYLRGCGVKAETPVALCCERSVEMIVGMLGIVKAGGVYVPLDAGYPEERLRWMLQDAGATVLLTAQGKGEALPEGARVRVRLDEDWEQIASESGKNLEPVTGADNLAYLIYTSGSTGQPKGVAIEQRSIIRLVSAQRAFDISESDVFALLSAVTFDASTLEIWAPLLNGAKLVVFPPYTPSLEELGTFLEKRGVTVLWLTSGLFNQMVSTQLHSLKGVRQLLTGGDIVSPHHVRLAMEALPDCAFINGYGPTENTTFTACYRAQGTLGPKNDFPIGYPISNTTVFVLDEEMQPVPAGLAGELYTSGAGLARGYFHRTELTAERFVPNPFSDRPGARLYRTGDRVCWQLDGTLQFLGRLDQQVKLRGFRIELEEIEAMLQRVAGVTQVMVVAREQILGDKRLVAYVAAAPDSPGADEEQLRNYVRSQLPEYMVPSAFLVLKKFPLTANGKVDRKALPDPEYRTPAELISPRTSTEQMLAELWTDVLKLDQIGVDDNFFDMGGHSLLATQIISRVRLAFEVELPLRALFESPTIAGLAERVEQELSKSNKAIDPPIVPVSRDLQIPLSFAQQRLWFLAQLEPDNPAYNMPLAFRLLGPLDLSAVERSLTEIVRRHEVLRTSFPAENGVPHQHIGEALPVALPVKDIAEQPNQEETVRQLLAAEVSLTFDLSRGPLLRALVIRLGKEEHVFLVTMHHIVGDGWSIKILGREFTAIYAAFSKGQPSPLRELPLQYADFAHWQRHWLSGDVLNEQLKYWREQLDGAPMLELPASYPRPAVPSAQGALVAFELSSDLVEQIKALSRAENATLFITLLSVFQLLLGRYAGQEDVSVGTLVANRNRRDTEELIGFFVNTLVLRTRLRRSHTFRGLLQDVRNTMLEAGAHQDLPFERLVDELSPVRNLGRTPLFQAMFELDTLALETPRLPGLEAGELGTDSILAKFEVDLAFREQEGKLHGVLTYATDLFSAEMMEQMANHFTRLLQQAVSIPDAPLRGISIMSEAEQAHVLSLWQAESADSSTPLLAHERIALHAHKSPDALAAIMGSRQLTYADLYGRATVLANTLRAQGAGPESRVGIYLEKSLETLIAVLAVMKSGAAYVPLDPLYPHERLSFMVRDSGIQFLLTDSLLSPAFRNCDLQILYVDGRPCDGAPSLAVARPVDPKSLAYVIYTSGSTGNPKGVMVTHQSLARAYEAYEIAYRLSTKTSRHLQMAAFSFDVFTSDFVRALCSGKTLVLCPREVLLVPQKLYELMIANSVDAAEFVPAVLRELVQYAEAANLRLDFMRLLVCSSDMWYGHDLERTLRLTGPDTCVINAYGLTECTIDSSWYQATGGIRDYSPVPIGRPFEGSSFYVLDEELQPVPIGVCGELYVGGRGVARGYLGRPDLTADRYVPNPFNRGKGARLYRTGDRARALPDGNIEMVGRSDNQIKIRGVRIELAEVEASLAKYPGVLQAAVVVHGEGTGKTLAAYVVTEPGASCDKADLRSFLQERLPLPAVPSAFVFLDRLPMTNSGKVDRRSLPEPLTGHNLESYTAPCTSLEHLVVEVWQEVLDMERIGIHDNFFELGGHSLLATQVISRLCKRAALEIPVAAIFEEPTAAHLAERIRKAKSEPTALPAPPMEPCSRNSRIPLSFAQQRLWVIDQLGSANQAYNVPSVLRITGELRIDVLGHALSEIVRRHEILRTTFPAVEGEPCQMISSDSQLPVNHTDLTGIDPERRGERVSELVATEIERPFDLANGPLIRAHVYTLPQQEHILAITAHHIISDAWSVGIFVRELSILYRAFLADKTPFLPPLRLQYADVSVWERTWLRGEVLQRHVDYWRKNLQGCAQILELPTDFPRPELQLSAGGIHTCVLAPETSRQLRERGQRAGATDFMTFLALINVWLFRYSQQTDILVGTPVSNRNQPDTEALIGFFINTLVFRTNIDQNATFLELLEQVRANALGAYAHQALPFEKLVDEMQVERHANRNPLFQVMFNMDTESNVRLDIPGLKVDAFELSSVQSRFDLHISARRSRQGMEFLCTYSKSLFHASTIQSMLSSLMELAKIVAEAAQLRINDVLERLKQLESESVLTNKRALAHERGQKLRGTHRRLSAAEPIDAQS